MFDITVSDEGNVMLTGRLDAAQTAKARVVLDTIKDILHPRFGKSEVHFKCWPGRAAQCSKTPDGLPAIGQHE